jgi:hypothetical protein
MAGLSPALDPDRLRLALGLRGPALQALGVPQLLERFAAGERIAATDPAVLRLHATATAHPQLAAAAGVSPGANASATLRAMLAASRYGMPSLRFFSGSCSPPTGPFQLWKSANHDLDTP